ncbi:MAG: hypothetical protein ABII01_00065 [Candidatus Woesearchaeota archaeon]
MKKVNMKIFEKRKPTFFEFALLIIGLAVFAIGFIVINSLYNQQGYVTWDLVIASLLWLILLFHLILASSSQDIKEELGILIQKTNVEIKLLRNDINKNKRKGMLR